MKQIFQRKPIKIFCAIVLLLLLVCLIYWIAYNAYYSTPKIYGLSEYTYDPLDGVKTYIAQEEYPVGIQSIPVLIDYVSREEWDVLGLPQLELWQHGAWHSLQLLDTTMCGPMIGDTILGPGTVHLAHLTRSRYGPRLRPGHYRVIVTLGDEGGYAAAEFDIVS